MLIFYWSFYCHIIITIKEKKLTKKPIDEKKNPYLYKLISNSKPNPKIKNQQSQKVMVGAYHEAIQEIRLIF